MTSLIEAHSVEKLLKVRPRINGPERGTARFEFILTDGFPVKMKPLGPHGNDGKLVAQHAGGMKRCLPGSHHGNRQAGAQCVHAGVTDGVDTDGVKPLFLGPQSSFENAHIHQQRIVVAVAKCRTPGHGFKSHLEAFADHFRRNLFSPVSNTRFIHRDGDDDLDFFCHTLLLTGLRYKSPDSSDAGIAIYRPDRMSMRRLCCSL